jgi:hypothetical protein
MNALFLRSCAALALFGLGGAAATAVQARDLNNGGGTRAATAFAPRAGADSLITTTNNGPISLTERALRRDAGAWDVTKVSRDVGAATIKITGPNFEAR